MKYARIGCNVALACLVLTGPALAQKQAGKRDRMANFMGLWSIKGMVDQACTNLSRRYNLNEQQEAYTRALMANRVQAFIDQHGAEFEGVLAEIMRTGADPKNPPKPEIIKRWGNRATPLFESAKKAILDGNAEWREILNDDQKKVHDADLAQMDHTFKTMDNQFERWKEGKFAPGETPFPGLTAQRRPGARIGGPRNPITTSEHFWKIWVLRFIKDYDLDKAQTATAMSILKEFQDRAAAYRQSKEAELTLARLAVQKASEAADREAQKKATEKLRELNQPFDDMFTKLKERLAGVPTEAQKAQHEQRQQDFQKRVSQAKQPATKPAAKPAAPVKAKPTKKAEKIEIK